MSKPADSTFDIAIFPLPQAVLFPEAAVPLNIFEPRYVQMVNWALEAEGLIALTSGVPESISKRIPWYVGAGVPQLLERRADGTMLILLRGRERFKIHSLDQREPYLLATGGMSPRKVEDENEIVNNPNYKWMCRLMEQWVCEQTDRESDREKLRAQFWNPWALLDWFGTLILQDGLIKQALLEIDELTAALDFAMRIFPASKLDLSGESTKTERWEN